MTDPTASTVVCKAAIAQLASHCFTQALHTKVRFYNEAAQAVPVAVPRFLAAQSQPGKGATLVLKDITESGAIPGNPGDALTAEQAALVVKQLACFHARFWNKADLLRTYYWLAGPVRRLEESLGHSLDRSVDATRIVRPEISSPRLSMRWLFIIRSIGATRCIFFQMRHRHLFIMIAIRAICFGTSLSLAFSS